MRFFWVLTFMACSVLGKAQPSIYLGIVGGGHGASSYIEHTLYTLTLKPTIIPAYHGGVMIKYFNQYNPNFKLNTGIQTGAIYAQKGWKQVFFSNLDPLTTRMDYLTIPIDGIVYLGGEKSKVFILLGIFTEFLISHESPSEPDPELIPIDDFYTYSQDRDKSFGYGLNGGLGFQQDIGPGAIHINAFFNYSISSFIETRRRADPTPDISNLYNAGLSIGYFLKLN